MVSTNADRVTETTCVTGTILGSDQNPVSGARVLCEGSDYSGSSEAYTGDDGRYTIASLPGWVTRSRVLCTVALSIRFLITS